MATEQGMIEPFAEAQRRKGVISYGLSSYGYDARAAGEFKIFTNVNNALVDPKRFSDESFVTRMGDTCIVPPSTFVLPHTVGISASRGTCSSSASANSPMPASLNR